MPPLAVAATDPGITRRRVATVIAVVVGVTAFAYRFLSEGRLSNDHYMHLAWAQQLLLGEVPGRNFVDPGEPLMYAMSALVQFAWPGPFSEVVLTTAMLGLSAALSCWLLHRLTGSPVAGIAAAAIQVAFEPRLYGYPKLLVPAATLAALWAYAHAPSGRRLTLLGAVAAAGLMLRYDLGLFATLGVTAALMVMPAPGWKPRTARLLHVALATAGFALPGLVLAQGSDGLWEAVRVGIEFSKGDSHQLLTPARVVALLQPDATPADRAFVWLYGTSYALTVVSGVVLLARRRRLDPPTLVTMTAATVLFACYCVTVLRHPLPARVPDAAALLAIVGTWLVAEGVRDAWRTRWTRPARLALAVTVTALALVVPTIAVSRVTRVAERLAETRIRQGWPKVTERVKALAEAGSRWPWAWYWPRGDRPEVVQYLSDCTRADDRVLVTWFAPEYFYFARRGFAAGHAGFSSGAAFATALDNAKMLARLQAERVPVVLRNEDTRATFDAAHPELGRYIDDNYYWFAHFTLRDGAIIRIGMNRFLQATEFYGPDRWPCGFVDDASPSLVALEGQSAGTVRAARAPALSDRLQP